MDDDEAGGEEEDGDEELREEEEPIADGVEELLVEHGPQLLEEEVAAAVTQVSVSGVVEDVLGDEGRVDFGVDGLPWGRSFGGLPGLGHLLPHADEDLLHGGDRGSVAGDAVTASILLQLLEDLLEGVRFVAGQQVAQLGAHVLIDVDFGYELADEFRHPLDVARGLLDDDQMVAGAVLLLEEQRRSAALDLTRGHDGDPVAQQVGFFHEMGR